MRTHYRVWLFVLMGAFSASALTLGCDDKKEAATGATASTEPAAVAPAAASPVPSARSALLRVEAQKVCMINDHFMGAPQIPVTVEGKTYYGCCPMCERKLREEPNSRFGVDPVSKKRVDKAAAVIGKLESGKVLYFESEQTFSAYQQRT